MPLSDVGITYADFEDHALEDFQFTVTVTPVTETEDFRGNKTFTDGTPYSETVVFIQKLDEKTREKLGLRLQKSSVILYEYDSNIRVGDKVSITLGDGTYVFKVHNQVDRNSVYRMSEIYYWGA